MLSLQNIHLSYDKKILDGISLEISAGEIIGIAGKSGEGKTSLLKIIAGLIDSTEGIVLLDGKQVAGPSMKLIPGHQEIQLVNQDFALDNFQTAEENIRNKMLHLPKPMQESFIAELLEVVRLTHLREREAQTLSGGEQQRLAIARALALEPKILLLDEPFVHLDTELRIQLISYLIELKRVRNMSIIIVTHNSEELISLTDKIVYLKGGKIKRIASPFDYYYRYKTVSEGRMFGLVNQLNRNDKSIHFRSDEYEIDTTSTPEISLQFLRSIFMGGYFLNEFITDKKKKIVLLNKSQLTDVEGISIKKKK